MFSELSGLALLSEWSRGVRSQHQRELREGNHISF